MSTHTQDLIDHYNRIAEEAHRNCRERGVRRLLHGIFTNLFLRMFIQLAKLIGDDDRAGTPPNPAPQPAASPAPTAAATPSRARPPAPRPHHSARRHPPIPEAAHGRATMHGQFEPPQLNQSIAEAPHVDRIVRPLCRLHAVDQRRKLSCQDKNPRRRPQPVSDVSRPRWREAEPLWTTEAAFLPFDSKNWLCGRAPNRVHFVTI